MVVARAVILAAGRGERLGELTAATPKPLLPVAGIPVIDRIAAALAAAGIAELIVVTGYLAETVERHLAATAPLPVAFIRQPAPDGTAGALRVAAPALGSEPFLLSWADIVTAPEHFDLVARSWRPELAAAVGVNRVEDPSALSAVLFDRERRIETIVEKPSGEPPSPWNSSGIMVVGPQIWDHLGRLEPSVRGELELPDALNALVAAGEHLEAVPLTGPWFDIGTPESLEAAAAAIAAGPSARGAPPEAVG